jgi:capsular polysaccharide biosynthesis protein
MSCESWSSRLATTFCNELIEVLDEHVGGALASPRGIESAHIVDPIDPVIQVSPSWYLNSFAGLIVGCLVGISVGFIKSSPAQAVREKDDAAVYPSHDGHAPPRRV